MMFSVPGEKNTFGEDYMGNNSESLHDHFSCHKGLSTVKRYSPV